MPPPRRGPPVAYRRVLVFSYSFVAGVGGAFAAAHALGRPVPLLAAWALYGAAAAIGAAAAFLLRRDREIRAETAGLLEAPIRLLDLSAREAAEARRRRSNALVLSSLCAAAFLLGAARHVHRSFIPPFDDDPETPQHLATILRRFPDETFSDKTIVRGRIAAEPEYSPDPTGAWGPGYVLLVVEPTEVVPDPEAGVAYAVSEGNVMVRISPRRREDLEEDPTFGEAFTALARGHAYADEVEIDATLRLPEGAANPGLFDPEAFYSDQDVFAQAFVSFWDKERPPVTIVEERWGNRTLGIPGTEWLDPFPLALALKEGMLKVIKRTVPHPESAFLAGVTLGMRFGLNGLKCPFEEAPAEDEIDQRLLVLDEFRWSGTSHVLAVSGLHVTIIAVLLAGIFETARVPRRGYAPFVCLGLVVFCLITGARPSSIRATIMNSLVVLTYAYGGRGLRASLLLAIGVAAVAILLDNPKWLVQPAFSLSFMAVLSLGLLTGPWSAVIKSLAARIVHPWWRPIRGALYDAVPFLGRWCPTIGNYVRDFTGAQLAIMTGMMGPLSFYYFCRFSVAGPFANFIAIPLIGIIVQMAILGCLIGLIPVVGPYLAMPLGAANWIFCLFFLWTAHASTYLPFPWVQTLTPRLLLLYYAALGLFAFRRPLLDGIRYRWLEARMSADRSALAALRLKIVAAIAAAIALVVACTVSLPDRRLEVTVLSVGYGTAVHVRTPAGAEIVVDGGPVDIHRGWDSGERTIGQYLLKRRVDSLDLAVAASLRPEDMAGLASVVRIFPTSRFVAPVDLTGWTGGRDDAVGRLVEAGILPNEEAATRGRGWSVAEAFRRLAGALNESWDSRRWGQALALAPVRVLSSLGRGGPGPAIETADRGTVLYQEETPGGTLTFTALHPAGGYEGEEAADRSLVLKIDHGDVSILLAHGIGPAGAEEVARLPAARSDAVLLPAHGSAEGIPRAFLDRVGARVAVASFRYPSGRGRSARQEEGRLAALLEDLRKRETETYRTDEHGAVRLWSDGTSLRVVPTLGAAAEDAEERRYEEF